MNLNVECVECEFDYNYPVMYGVLLLIDRVYLHQEGFPRQKPAQKDSTTMATFLKKYEQFVLDNDQDQHTQELPTDEDYT